MNTEGQRGVEMTATKVCTRCEETKPATNEFFSKNGRRLRSLCKACDRAYRVANREHMAEYRRAYYAANKEHLNERSRAYQKNNRKRVIEQVRSYYAANRERMIEVARARRIANPEKITAQNAVRRAVANGNLPKASTCDCFMCGAQAQDFHHVSYDKPLEVFPVCRSCHHRWHKAMLRQEQRRIAEQRDRWLGIDNRPYVPVALEAADLLPY